MAVVIVDDVIGSVVVEMVTVDVVTVLVVTVEDVTVLVLKFSQKCMRWKNQILLNWLSLRPPSGSSAGVLNS